jgi:hypothetical protein
MEPSGERPEGEGQSSNTGLLAMRWRARSWAAFMRHTRSAHSVAEATTTAVTTEA